MRITEFWQLMEARFGAGYARSLAADYRVPELGSTIDEAFAAGVDAKQIWRAVVVEFEIPRELQ